MKAGLVMAFHAVATLADRDGVTLLVTGDEEIGSPTSRALIESEAAGRRRGAGAGGVGGRRRAEDRPQGHLALRDRGGRPGCPRRPGAGEGRQRDARACPPGPCGRGPGGQGCRHDGDTHRHERGHDPQHGAGGGRASRSTYGPGRRPSSSGSTPRCGHSRPCSPARRWWCTAASTGRRWRSRRPRHLFARASALASPAGPAARDGRRRRRRLGRQLHRRCRRRHARRPRRGRRGRARRGRARPRGPPRSIVRRCSVPCWPTVLDEVHDDD